MLVKLVPNYRRRGVGRRPERAHLPDAVLAPSDLNPVLAAATQTGLLVYPPLHPNESVEVRLLDSGDFQFTMFVAGPDRRPVPVFSVRLGGSAGWGGLGNQDIVYIDRRANVDAPLVQQLLAALTTNVMPGSAGQFGFLGAYNFVTPEGWDSLCVSTLNNPRSDGIPSLNCLIETDWYPQNTEFRYAFEHGESLTLSHDTALGQVLFLPRAAVRFVEAAGDVAPSRRIELDHLPGEHSMDVRLVPAARRGGIGRLPAHENRRAWLPQQARFCPVVEDAQKLGALVYPPLAATESLQAIMRNDGTMAITLYVSDELGQRSPAFVAELGAGEARGFDRAAVTVVDQTGAFDQTTARDLLAAVIAGANAPPGSIGLRGAYRFITPQGVDTVFTSVFNELVRPIVPVMTTRIETDEQAEESVFWYLLRPGAALSIAGDAPIGQAFFLPREELRTRDASPVEEQSFMEVQEQYWSDRAAKAKTTNYGATFTYHYRDHQKMRRDGDEHALGALQDGPTQDHRPAQPLLGTPPPAGARRRRRKLSSRRLLD